MKSIFTNDFLPKLSENVTDFFYNSSGIYYENANIAKKRTIAISTRYTYTRTYIG